MASETKPQLDISDAEYDNWIVPKKALAKLSALMPDEAAKLQLWENLTFSHVRAVGRKIYFGGQARADYQIIPHNYWKFAREDWMQSDLWSASEITINVPIASRAYSGDTQELTLFGVRFDPAGIDQLIRDAGGNVSASPPKETVAQDTTAAENASGAPSHDEPTDVEREGVKKGPNVSQALLDEWYSLYQKAYPGNADTEETAIESATGMFPGKHVARTRIRALRGRKGRGRRPQEKA